MTGRAARAPSAAAAGAKGAGPAPPGPPTTGVAEARNEVILVGRVSGTPEERSLPSGDALVSWRVVVDRPAPRRAPPGVRPTTIDTVDCVAWSGALRRTARGLSDGDVVAVEGALRRRFWRAGAGALSRTEVEVASLRRVTRRPR